jgi:hypothetical protein
MVEMRSARVGSPAPKAGRRLRSASGLLGAIASALALGLAGASGCGDVPEGAREATPTEEIATAQQAAGNNLTCVSLTRATGKVFDAMVSSEKVANNYGASTIALAGASTTNVADRFYALFKFDTAAIPVNATIVSASIVLVPVAAAAGTWNAHLVTSPWNEATVTWSSFGSAFSPAVLASGSAAAPSILVDVAQPMKGWVSGLSPNHGVLIELPGASQLKLKTAEWPLAGGRPRLNVCYALSCAPGFADCNGLGADGCEANLEQPRELRELRDGVRPAPLLRDVRRRRLRDRRLRSRLRRLRWRRAKRLRDRSLHHAELRRLRRRLRPAARHVVLRGRELQAHELRSGDARLRRRPRERLRARAPAPTEGTARPAPIARRACAPAASARRPRATIT